MEKLHIDYSYKNIPTPSERTFQLQLIEKVKLVIKRMRWKAHFFDTTKNDSDNNNDNKQIPETYGLKTLNCPPQINDFVPFEADMFEIVKSLKFRKTKNQFQAKLRQDIQTIRNTKTTLTFADKTSNIYKPSKEQHNKLLNNAVTSTYKKMNNNLERKINKIGKSIVKDCVQQKADNRKDRSLYHTQRPQTKFPEQSKGTPYKSGKERSRTHQQGDPLKHQQRADKNPIDQPMEKYWRGDLVVQRNRRQKTTQIRCFRHKRLLPFNKPTTADECHRFRKKQDENHRRGHPNHPTRSQIATLPQQADLDEEQWESL